MRLLFISSFYLFGDTRFGGTKRLYYFARAWENSARLSVICLDGCREWDPERHRDEFRDFLMLPGLGDTGWRRRLLRAPLDIGDVLEGHGDKIRAFLEGKDFDAVLLAYPWSLSFMGGDWLRRQGNLAYLEDDLVFEQYEAASAAAASPLRRWLKRIRRGQLLAYYRSRLARVRHFISISRQESAIMGRHFPHLNARIVKYGIPLADYPFLPPAGDKRVLGFIGNYQHSPNADALDWLLKEVGPAIRRACPEIRLLIAGKHIPEDLRRAYAGEAWIAFRENVADLGTFYRDIGVFINPVRTGRGMRTKVVEAAAFGRPILSTPLGAEGMEDLVISQAETAESMAREYLRVLEEPGYHQSVLRNREAVETAYDLEKIAGSFLQVLGGRATQGSPPVQADRPG